MDLGERLSNAWESARNSWRHAAEIVLLEVEMARAAGNRAEAEELLVLAEPWAGVATKRTCVEWASGPVYVSTEHWRRVYFAWRRVYRIRVLLGDVIDRAIRRSDQEIPRRKRRTLGRGKLGGIRRSDKPGSPKKASRSSIKWLRSSFPCQL